ADRPAAESLGGGTGVRVGRGGRDRRPRESNDACLDDLNGQGNDQGIGANRGVEGVNGNVEGADEGALDFSTIIAQQLQKLLPAMNVLVNGNRVGCSYKEFLTCNPKEYDGNGGAIVLTRWIEKMENVGSHATYIDRFHELARLVMHLVTLESRMIERYMYGLAPRIHGMVAATEPTTIQKAIQISGALTDKKIQDFIKTRSRLQPDKVIRNGSIKKVEKRGNMREPSKDRSGRDDNKRTRIGNVFCWAIEDSRLHKDKIKITTAIGHHNKEYSN
nr:reverse transcriptase domain-containing protein [Tanacetum cinerariifolium]